MDLIQMVKSSQNPQTLVCEFLETNAGNNPLFANLLSMAKVNDTKGIENFARNILKERGLDFDKEFSSFRNTFGL